MASWTRQEITTTRVEYVLQSPTDLGEVEKTVATVAAQVGHNGSVPVEVTARDDEIVFSFNKDDQVPLVHLPEPPR